MSFAAQRESWMTCMYVRLLGPCFKTGGKLNSYTKREGRRTNPFVASYKVKLHGSDRLSARVRRPKLSLQLSPMLPHPRRVVLSTVWQGATLTDAVQRVEMSRSHVTDFMLF